MATLRNFPKPSKGICTTFAPSFSLRAAMPSVLNESATITSSAQLITLRIAASIFLSSLYPIIYTDTLLIKSVLTEGLYLYGTGNRQACCLYEQSARKIINNSSQNTGHQ